MQRALGIARYFLSLYDPQEGETISNLKPQKLLYYAQGVYLARHGVVLFPEDIAAWDHGPVVSEVYQAFKTYGNGAIPIEEAAPADFPPKVQEVLDEVHQVFGQYSAWKLSQMTHGEPPWTQTMNRGIIVPQIMRDYFQSRFPPFVVLPEDQFKQFESSLLGPPSLSPDVLRRAARIGDSVEFLADGVMRTT
jgi:uncharacterized phage-associated protein